MIERRGFIKALLAVPAAFAAMMMGPITASAGGITGRHFDLIIIDDPYRPTPGLLTNDEWKMIDDASIEIQRRQAAENLCK